MEEVVKEAIIKHLLDGGHITGADDRGFWYWDVENWPLPAGKIYHELKKIHEIIIEIYTHLKAVKGIHPFPPRITIEDLDVNDLKMENGFPHYRVAVNTLLSFIKENLIIMERVVKNEIIE